MLTEQFPLSVAMGDAFCNRTAEIKRLKLLIEEKRPVLLVSPRRYGKTSLALRAIAATKLPYAHIDLFSVIDEADIERLILKGIARLISSMESTIQKAMALAAKVFEGTHVKVSFPHAGMVLDVSRNREKPAYRVLDVLERLERLSEEKQQQMVIFFDEFQCIGQATDNHSMEAVLRQVAQLTKSISFVFSGSNRHLLAQLFEDRNRPFYKLCERITLRRIEAEPYGKHIQQVAQDKWGKEVSQEALSLVYEYTELHPYYMNVLCSRMMRLDMPPAKEDITALWNQYLSEEKSNVSSELEMLSKNQRKLLIVLAREHGTDLPLGKEFVHATNMSKTTIKQSLDFLEKRDFICKNNEGRTVVLDPLILNVLLNEYS